MHSGIGGWSNKVVGPSPIKWSADHALPHELSIAQISDLVSAFVAAAQRAVTAGIDSLEIHAAHGYLIHSFLSGASNTRNDAYGGSFNNRIRLLMEVIDAVRVVIPDSMPLFVRVSATDWLQKDRYPTAWDIPDTIKLAKLLYERGVDLIDVSSGGNHEFQQIPPHNEHQIEIAGKVRAALKQAGGEAAKLLVAAVGGISNGIFANSIVDEDNCPARTDVVFAGRAFLRDSGFALACADDLNIRVQWPLQYLRKGDRKYSRL
jgi:2,4-dienoyl-CoA reductase-like NADH-dependent reductase (Old Yellow Enzyme family)